MKKRKLILEDGSEYIGTGFGSPEEKKIELVFNTSMAGYQEIISDLSYTDQAVVMTYPLIGNYGTMEADNESNKPGIQGLIVREYCDRPSNFRCEETLEKMMFANGIAGIQGVDTRQIARHIRNVGSCKAMITDEAIDTSEAVADLKAWNPPTDQVARASCKKAYRMEPDGSETLLQEDSSSKAAQNAIAVIDCGIKKNILRELQSFDRPILVFPWNTKAEEILRFQPAGVVISNGPGNPEDCAVTIETIRGLVGKQPLMGICLGHQIISLAFGAKTYKLKFGHRGGNHPVKNLLTGKIEITSQNHSYAVVPESLEGTGLTATHINLLDNTIEGVASEKDHVFSVQYHPESAPGPCDSKYLFARFRAMIEGKEDK
ncbi:MAG: glutamine-hydrolyzing carbamoyl-phosphate synthase small subunit [Lachnospiraceae bacterium]|nr:glutamine-hydrolyzing carbamoyl-phosphate synthase small subunit [Lachnospiraceae bacterium]